MKWAGNHFFIIFLPEAEERSVTRETTDNELPGGKERILFVDDEQSIIAVGTQRLERLGYSVTAKTNPIEALEEFRSNPDIFDLVLTDMTMPRLTGDKLAEKIRAIHPRIPIIINTGYSEHIDKKKAKEMGVSGYLEKPYGIRDLALSVRKVLDDR